jgi:uncharacterized cupredoxin-like copper-binding protein
MRGPQLVAMLLLAAASAAHAHGTPGGVASATAPADTMRFTPARIEVRRGETVSFRVTNAGKALHETVLGTLADLREHAELMRRFPNMQHDEPNMIHVAPGKTGTLTWQFTRAGEFHYGCLVPGHFEAGMVGMVVVR